jgi:hypothetical protein
MERGYAVATFFYGDVEPDDADGFAHGVRAFFPAPASGKPAPDEWGAIAAWGWGISRVMDYLVNVLGLPGGDKPDYPLFTFGYYYYFLEVLFQNNREVEALELMRRYYGRWLDMGATTFGEHFRPLRIGGVNTIGQFSHRRQVGGCHGAPMHGFDRVHGRAVTGRRASG